MQKYSLVRFNKKSGKVDKNITSEVLSMLKLWALKNTTKSKDTVIFESFTGEVMEYIIGQPNGFPKVADERDEQGKYGNINDVSAGFLESYKKELGYE